MINKYAMRYDGVGEKRGPSKSKLDTKGAMTVIQQVQRFDAAGALLQAYRRGAYDTNFENASMDGFDDPRLSPDFDPAMDMHAVEAFVDSKQKSKSKQEFSTSFPESSQSEHKESSGDGVESEKTGE